MSLNTAIEWTEATWNPTRGCSRISPGCKHCYAERDAARKNANPKLPSYHGFAIFDQHHQPHWTGKVELVPSMLDIPRKRRAPTTWFVNSMSDLFHPNLPFGSIRSVYEVMYETSRHTYQVLTKHGAHGESGFMEPVLQQIVAEFGPMPRHIWHGVSVENADYLWRLDVLMRCPVSVRFVSVEPLRSGLNLWPWLVRQRENNFTRLDWVIVGGESGPGAVPMRPEWVRGIRDQCEAAGVPFFFKQWGNWMECGPGAQWDCSGCLPRESSDVIHVGNGRWLERMQKNLTGRLLDGREWNEMPEAAR